MNSNEMAKIAIVALDDKKAKDIKVIDISNVSVIILLLQAERIVIRFRQWQAV